MASEVDEPPGATPPADRPMVPRTRDMREHWCWCGAWGSHGLGGPLVKGQGYQWLCAEHLPLGWRTPDAGSPAAHVRAVEATVRRRPWRGSKLR